VGCRTVLAKRTLVRLVHRPEGVQVDPTGKLSGRGAYLHNRRSCWEKGLKGPLANALRIPLTGEDIQFLQKYMQTLPAEEDGTGGQA
jgi:uncharacterized protein